MEFADDRLGRTNRRANAGSRLQELLDQGLAEEEERLLEALSDVSTDSSFHGSDEEAVDLIDSDFSEEEVEGVLEGETVETEASIRREERQERQADRKRRLQRSQQFASVSARQAHSAVKRRRREKGVEGEGSQDDGDDGNDDAPEIDYRAVGRLRPAPTIPLQTRLHEALERAQQARAATATTDATSDNVDDDDGDDDGEAAGSGVTRVAGSSPSRFSPTVRRRRRRATRTLRSARAPPAELTEHIVEAGQIPDTWWSTDTMPLTYPVVSSHCVAQKGWLCSPTLPPLYIAAAQDRVAVAYTSAHPREVWAVDARGRIWPVENGAVKRVLDGRSARHRTDASAPVVAYVLAPPRASLASVRFASGRSTLAVSQARTVLSFAALPAVLLPSAAQSPAS